MILLVSYYVLFVFVFIVVIVLIIVMVKFIEFKLGKYIGKLEGIDDN